MNYAYSEQLRDPRWQKRRLKVLERDNWKCQCCYSTNRTLHVHHLKYSDEPWDAPDEHLETLCEECHDWRTWYDDAMEEKHPVCTRFLWLIYWTVKVGSRDDREFINEWKGSVFDLLAELKKRHSKRVEEREKANA